MNPFKKIFLNKNKMKYVTINHSPTYGAQEIAEIFHISAKKLAESIMVKINNKLMMVVLPERAKVYFEKLKKLLTFKKLSLRVNMNFKSNFLGANLELFHLLKIYSIQIYMFRMN